MSDLAVVVAAAVVVVVVVVLLARNKATEHDYGKAAFLEPGPYESVAARELWC